MLIKNIFSKHWRHSMCAIIKYSLTLSKKSNEEITEIVNREKRSRGWCSQRSYFLVALRHECKRRGLVYIQ